MGAKRHLNSSTQEGTYRHTDTHTDGHRDLKTESAQRANSVKRDRGDVISTARVATCVPTDKT